MVAPIIDTLRTTWIVALLALVIGTAGCRPSTATATDPASDPAPDLLASGRCLGRICLGMSEATALGTLGAADAPVSAGSGYCFHLRDSGLELSFDVDAADPGRPIRAILVTSLPHCAGAGEVEPAAGGAPPVGDAGRVADCRGVRPGDPESFATKMHRQATPIAAAADPWNGAPAGVRGFEDVCEPAAADVARAGLYLRDGRVVGLAVWRP